MLTKEMKVVIEKNLPAQTAGVLKERIMLVDDLTMDIVKLKDHNKLISEELKILKDIVENQRQIIAKAGDLSKKELDLEKRERELSKSILEIRCAAAEKEITSIFRLAETVFRNPRFVVTESGTAVAGTGGSNNGPGYIASHPYTKTIMTEET